MAIEEAIIRIEETAKNYSDEYEFYLSYGKQEEAQENFRHYSEQRQIAKWLKELKIIHDEIDSMSDYDEIFIGYLRKKMKEVT